MKLCFIALSVVIVASGPAVAADLSSSAKQTMECMVAVLKASPNAGNVRTQISRDARGTYPVIEYTFLDKSGRRHPIKIAVTGSPNDLGAPDERGFYYYLATDAWLPGGEAGDVLAAWEVKCRAMGTLITQ
jgi:hypothetical protein